MLGLAAVDLAALARQQGLPLCAESIEQTSPSLQTDVDPGLQSPPATKDPAAAIDQMRRRGLDPRLVRSVLDWLAPRPLERALFSWDALCSSVIPDSDPGLLASLRKNAAVVRDVLPAPGSTFCVFSSLSSTAAVERWAADAYAGRTVAQLGDAGSIRALGALEQLRRSVGAEEIVKSGLAESTRKFAMMLHLSHLSTLASCYLDYVTHALAYRAALPELLEVLLDVGAVDDLPSDDEIVGDKSLVSFELFGYAQARAGLIRNQSRDVFEQLKAKVQFDYGRASLEDITRAPRVHLLLADAGLRQKEMVVPFPVLDVIASHYPRWRYAHRVRAACAAALAAQDDQPLAFTEKFLEQFGNEFRMWSSMRRYAAAGAPWTGKLLSRLAGEVAMLPHDWMAWASLGAALKTPERNGVAELEARAEAQCAFGPAN